MKRAYRLIFITFLLTTLGVNAQPGPMGGPGREKIEAQRVAFITDRLRLTPDEAARFWPIYNEYRDALKDLRDDIERPELMSLTDDEASKLIEQHLQQEQKRLDLKRNLVTRLRTAVPARKIVMLHAAENAFNRELLRRAQEFKRP